MDQNSEFERLEVQNRYPAPLIHHYATEYLKSKRGRALESRLTSDPRVTRLVGTNAQRGSYSFSWDLTKLAWWYLWLEDSSDTKTANNALEAYLRGDEIEILVTLWVLGIKVETAIDLGNGIRILPSADLPESSEQKTYSKTNWPSSISRNAAPECALVKRCRIPKVLPIASSDIRVQNSLKIAQELALAAILLNALDGLSCEPNYATSYTESNVPFGPFGGGGGGWPLFDVTSQKNSQVAPESVKNFPSLFQRFLNVSPAERARLALVLNRLGQAKRRVQLEDKMLDLGIALEMLLLNKLSEREQLSLTFRLRGSWLLAQNASERGYLFKSFKFLYDCRSNVAHNGSLGKKFDFARSQERDLESLACRVFRQLLLNGEPDWDDLVLGR